MWPWSAAVFAYLCYTAYTHLRHREAPDGWAVLLVAVAATVPDLVDKPLSWQFDALPSGYALGHSLFVAVPLAGVAFLVARRAGRPHLGVAFGIAAVSHDVGDALEHVVEDGSVWYGLEHVLWPVYRLPPAAHRGGLSGTTLRYFLRYVHEILTLHVTPYLALVGAITAVVLPIWVADGYPGARELWVVLTYPVASLRQ